MKTTKRKIINKIILLVVLLIFFIITYQSYVPESNNIVQGSINLENWDFSKNDSISLEGDWEFFPNILASELFFNLEGEKGVYFHVPGLWNNFIIDEKKIEGTGYGSYRLKINLPENQVFYLKTFDLSTAYNIYVNGKLLSSNGRVGKNKEMHLPEFKTKLSSFHTNSNITELIIEVSNFSQYKGGFWKPIILGNLESITHSDDAKKLTDILIISFLLTTSFIYLNISAYIKKEKIFVYLSGFLSIISIRILCTGEKLINFFVPSVPWDILMKLEYLSYYLGVPVFIIFIFNYFKYNEFNKRIRFSLLFYCVNSLIVILFKPIIFTSFLTYINIYTLIFGFYIIYIAYNLSLKDNNGGKKIIFGTIILLLTVFIEIFSIQKGGKIINSSIFGQIVFLFFLIFETNKKFSTDVVEERKVTAFLKDFSNKDSLTGLFNYHFISKKINEICNDPRKTLYSVAMFDLDDFKLVNDTFGHKKGDLVLKTVAKIFKENIRGTDFAARYGGEEFLLLFYNTNLDDAYLVCEKIRSKVEIELEEKTGIRITISGGVAEMTPEIKDIITIADILLYKAKNSGKNKIEK